MNKEDFMSLKNKSRLPSYRVPLLLALISMVLCLSVRLISRIPVELLHSLQFNDILPPLWLSNLLSLAWSLFIGFAAGIVACEIIYGRAHGRKEILIYQGGLFFVAVIILTNVWYPVFFSCGRLVVSCLIALVTVALSSLCAIIWARVSAVSGVILGAYSLWLTYVLLLNLSVLFHL
jgi:tryptophan-rich sensory protein